MYTIEKYNSTDKMSDLICDNYQMLLVISRFEIKLGFGEKTIGEVCRTNDVDIDTFLSVVNLLTNERASSDLKLDVTKSIPAIIKYLQNSHNYFLDFRLPCIREKLVNALSGGNNDVTLVIMRFFDEYVTEVRKHMMYEDNYVFPYINTLLNGEINKKYNITIFSKQHNHVEEKLSELKNILIKYYTASSNELNSVLFDIFTCAEDLASHNAVEDHLMVPAVVELEHKIGKKNE